MENSRIYTGIDDCKGNKIYKGDTVTSGTLVLSESDESEEWFFSLTSMQSATFEVEDFVYGKVIFRGLNVTEGSFGYSEYLVGSQLLVKGENK